MKTVVTGAAGHLGSHVVPELLQAGFGVTGLDIVQPKVSLPETCAFVQADLTDPAALAEVLGGADVIVHCASLHPWKPYTLDQYLDSNLKGTWNLYSVAAEVGVQRVVLTSSIAATGYLSIPMDAWPVSEEAEFPLDDLYSFTKHAQEDIARLFAHRGQVQTIALRPPTFVPMSPVETAFQLTGNFAVVEDMASAHVAAAKVLAGMQRPGREPGAFESVYVTNQLPYCMDDVGLLEAGRNVRRLVEKYWPEAYDWLTDQGYQGVALKAIYRLDKARELLGWEPRINFEQWIESEVDSE